MRTRAAAPARGACDLAQTRAHPARLSAPFRARSRSDFGAAAALRHVRAPLGPWNWALFRPAKGAAQLLDAGSLSLAEMAAHLDEAQVCYGLLRMGFGSGQFRRTKWVGIWWNGPHATALTRGKAVGAKEECLRRIEPFALTVSASCLEELSLRSVLERVRRAAHIDGDGTDAAGGGGGGRGRGGSHADPFSAATFEEALAEEVAASAAFFNEHGGGERGGGGGDVRARPPAEVAGEVVSGVFNWACFGLGDDDASGSHSGDGGGSVGVVSGRGAAVGVVPTGGVAE